MPWVRQQVANDGNFKETETDRLIQPTKKRQSNIELCRIVSMLLIIAHHAIV